MLVESASQLFSELALISLSRVGPALAFQTSPSSIAGLGLKDWISVVGGMVGLIGGLISLWSTIRPLKVSISHLNRLGIVVQADGTTQKIHLPLVISNLSRKNGVITFMRLNVTSIAENKSFQFDWEVFWKEDAQLQRTIDRTCIPIPVPNYSCVERSIGFCCNKPVKWEPQLYEAEVQVKLINKKELKTESKFYFYPSNTRCENWYRSQSYAGNWVDKDVPIYTKCSEVPIEGA